MEHEAGAERTAQSGAQRGQPLVVAGGQAGPGGPRESPLDYPAARERHQTDSAG
jgi:hypothetical protein